MGFFSDRLDWDRDGAAWPLREHSRFVQAAGVRWHVQVLGAAPDPRPVALLLHGTGAATHSWRGLAPLLARDVQVIAPDLPGHGFTAAARPGARGLPSMAAALGALTQALGVSPALIVGHSAGAALGARMALDGRAAPRAILALNGAFMPFRGLAGATFPTMAKLLALNPLVPRVFAWGADSALADRLLASVGASLDPAGRALYQRLFACPAHVAGALGMMAEWDLRPLLRDLPRLKPALTLAVGEADRAVPPADADAVARLVPGARVVRLAGLGHLAHEEKPEVAADLARRALAAAG
ncbi:MAG: alpha/beta fold hydrolase BchO [Rubrimonas sp.]